jgi:hypothetical protein
MLVLRQAAARLQPQQRHAIGIARNLETHLVELAQDTAPAHSSRRYGQAVAAPIRSQDAARPNVTRGSIATWFKRDIARSMAASSSVAAASFLDQRAAQGIQRIDGPARLLIKRHMQRHGQ